MDTDYNHFPPQSLITFFWGGGINKVVFFSLSEGGGTQINFMIA